MGRVTHRDFSQGLWLTGPGELLPSRALRRAQSVQSFALSGGAVVSRWGNALVTQAPDIIRNLLWFNNTLFVQSGTDFGKVVGASYTSVIFGMLRFLATNCTVRSAAMIPTTETDVTAFPHGPEHLFVCGSMNTDEGSVKGGNTPPFKLSTDGEWSLWGMRTPFLDWNVGHQGPVIILISNINGQSAISMDPQYADQSTPVVSTVNKQSGTSSAGFTINGGGLRGAGGFPATVDLLFPLTGHAGFPPNPAVQSSQEDYIRLWVFCDAPENLEFLDIIMDVTEQPSFPGPPNYFGSPDGFNDAFSFRVLVDDSIAETNTGGTSDDARLGDARSDDDNPRTDTQNRPFGGKTKKLRLKNLGETLNLSDAATFQILTDLATVKLSSKANVWTLLRIPKRLFSTSGKAIQGAATDSTQRTWAHLQRVRLSAKASDSGGLVLLFDDMSLHLGAGLFGDYKYALTYKNSRTGARGNPSEIKTIKGVERNAVEISGPALLSGNLPVGHDRVEIWRSLGNGDALFKVVELDPRTQLGGGSYFDATADYEGMQESIPIGIGTKTTKYITDEALPFDNEAPNALTLDVAGPHLGALWTVSANPGDRGKLFYSPPGRPESIGGFILVTSDDEPLVRVIHWNGIYAWSTKRVFTVEGTNPYIAREIFGVPGTQDPSSVVPTPNGVAYRAYDGPRLFNGATAPLLAIEAVAPIFNDQQLFYPDFPSTPTFKKCVTAVYHRDEYILSDVTNTYAVNMRTGAWRNCGYAARALIVDQASGHCFGGIGRTVVRIELPFTETDFDNPIFFGVEVPGTVIEDQSGFTKLVQRLYLDINTRVQDLGIVIDAGAGQEQLLANPINTQGRMMVEVSLAIPSDIVSVHIFGALIRRVDIFGVYYDVHTPEQGGALT